MLTGFCFRIAALYALTALPTSANLKVKRCAPAPAATQMQYQDLVNCAMTGQSQVFTFPQQAGDAILIDLVNFYDAPPARACFRGSVLHRGRNFWTCYC